MTNSPEQNGWPGGQGGPGYVSPPSQQQNYPAPFPQQQGYPQALPGGQLTHLVDGTPLASVWMRLLANILDGVFLNIALWIISIPVGLVFSALFTAGGALAQNNESAGIGLMFGGMFVMYGALFLLFLVIYYFCVIWRTRKVGATPGKQILGLRVRSVQADGQLTNGQVWTRQVLVPVVGSLTGGILNFVDVIWCLFDTNRQCLHDKAAGTVVITDREPPLPPNHPLVQQARHSMPAPGWVANGPDPATRPGYPR